MQVLHLQVMEKVAWHLIKTIRLNRPQIVREHHVEMYLEMVACLAAESLQLCPSRLHSVTFLKWIHLSIIEEELCFLIEFNDQSCTPQARYERMERFIQGI